MTARTLNRSTRVVKIWRASDAMAADNSWFSVRWERESNWTRQGNVTFEAAAIRACRRYPIGAVVRLTVEVKCDDEPEPRVFEVVRRVEHAVINLRGGDE